MDTLYIYDKIHFKLEQKKPTNILQISDIYRIYFRFPIYIGNLHYKLEQKTPTKYVENF